MKYRRRWARWRGRAGGIDACGRGSVDAGKLPIDLRQLPVDLDVVLPRTRLMARKGIGRLFVRHAIRSSNWRPDPWRAA